MLEEGPLTTLVYHTGLPFDSSTKAPTTPAALEAQRALANTLVLHAPARKLLAMMGAGAATARALSEPLPTDRLFLVCRIGFLVTADGFGVKDLVETGDIVNRIIHVGRPSPRLPTDRSTWVQANPSPPTTTRSASCSSSLATLYGYTRPRLEKTGAIA